MYAIVDIAGKQFQVTQNMRLKVPRLQAEPGKSVQFDKVLVYEDAKGNISFGDPILKNLNINATLISHGRDKKIIVFKKKRRKGYRVKRGHRQDFSLIEITAIGTSAKTSKAKAEDKKPDKAAPKKTASKAKAAEKTATKPKTAAKSKAKTKTASTEKSTPKTKAAAKPKAKATAKPKNKTKAAPDKSQTTSAKEDTDGS